MLTSLRKSCSVSSFSLACSKCIVHRVSFIFHLNAFLVPVCTRGLAYLFCWPRGRGIGLVCTRRFSFHEFYNFLLFNFLIFIFLEDIFLPTTFTHTHDPRPTPTTHDPHPRPTTSTHYPRPLPTTHEPRQNNKIHSLHELGHVTVNRNSAPEESAFAFDKVSELE